MSFLKTRYPFFIIYCVFVILFSVFTLSPVQAANKANKLIDLYLGQSEMLSVKDVQRISVGNGALMDVKVLHDSSQILLLAKNSGITDLRVWQKNGQQSRYQFRIMKQSPEQVLEQVQSHLTGMEGVQVRLAGNQVVIEGQSLRNEDLNRIKVIEEQFPNISNHVSAGGVSMRSMIYFDVKILEVSKIGREKLGIEWDKFTSGPTFGYLGDFVTNSLFRGPASTKDEGGLSDLSNLALAAGTGNVFLGMSSLLKTKINLLKSKGYGRVLAEPKLSCRSGGKADFQVGGEIPYESTSGIGSSNVEFKQYGIMLDVEPVADAEGYIMTKIKIEMSNPETADGEGLPRLITRRTSSEMNLRSGETMVVSGLVETRNSKGVSKMPFFGDIPIIGELFKSRAFDDDEKDLVIFLTPTIIDPEHPINQQALRKASEMEEVSDKNLRFNLMD